MDDFRVRKASELVSSILSPSVAARAGEWSRLSGAWKRIAGERLAAHSRAADVRNGIVIVEADHPGWIQLLQLDQDRMLEAVKKAFPGLGVVGIAFRLAARPGEANASGPAAVSPPDERDAAESVAEDPGAAESARTLDETIDAVSDDGFRRQLRDMARSLGRKR